MTAIYISFIAFAGVLAQWFAWFLRIPAILILLLVGLVLGPFTNILNPDAIFGDLLFPIISLAVSIILFEGALMLHFRELPEIGKVVRNLCSIGLLVTFVVISVSSYFLLNLSWQVSAVIGAVLVVTGPTVIGPILNTMRPTKDIDRILRWEGIIIDPIGALFAVLVYEAVLLSDKSSVLQHTIIALLTTIMVGIGLGVFFGWVITQIIRREWLPYEYQKFTVLASVLLSFSVSNYLSHESGLLTVTIFGIFLANQDDLELDSILEFKEDLSQILISSLFIILAARLNLADLTSMGALILPFLAVILFVARPLAIAVSTVNSNLSLQAKILLAWMAPRGIVAAAVSSVFALGLSSAGIADADKIVPLVFAVIIVTVVLQGLTAVPFARMLGVRQPKPSTVLIVGANHLARAVGRALQDKDIPVYLSDPAWENCRLARMDGLNCYYGNPQSEHAERFLPLTDLQTVLCLSPNRHHNALSVQYFSHLIDEENVFSLKTSEAGAKANKDSSTFLTRQILFDASFARLSSMLSKGSKVGSTKITEEFTWEDYQQKNPNYIPLFILRFNQEDEPRLKPFISNMEETPQAGDIVIAMQPEKVLKLSETK